MRFSTTQTPRFQLLPVLSGLLFLLCLPVEILPQAANYTVSWLGVPVVDVTIDTHKDKHGSYTEYHAQTRDWFNRIYAVDNRYRIWVQHDNGQPLRYEKQIHERGVRDSLWARYDLKNPPGIIYSNGTDRFWIPGGQTFFSALVWLQHHDWEVRERQVLKVEVEGVIWEVELVCQKGSGQDENSAEGVEISVKFLDRLQGEPVLATTDVLTYMLPGKDHHLRFALNLEQNLILWVEFGSWPFIVRADLDRGSDRQ